MYEIFQKLLKKEGLRPSDVSRATGISSSTLTDWKMGRSTPKQDKMQAIADYLGVTPDYLLTGKESRDEFSKYQEQADLLTTIRHDAEMLHALEKFYRLPDKKKQHILELIDLFDEIP